MAEMAEGDAVTDVGEDLDTVLGPPVPGSPEPTPKGGRKTPLRSRRRVGGGWCGAGRVRQRAQRQRDGG